MDIDSVFRIDRPLFAVAIGPGVDDCPFGELRTKTVKIGLGKDEVKGFNLYDLERGEIVRCRLPFSNIEIYGPDFVKKHLLWTLPPDGLERYAGGPEEKSRRETDRAWEILRDEKERSPEEFQRILKCRGQYVHPEKERRYHQKISEQLIEAACKGEKMKVDSKFGNNAYETGVAYRLIPVTQRDLDRFDFLQSEQALRKRDEEMKQSRRDFLEALERYVLLKKEMGHAKTE